MLSPQQMYCICLRWPKSGSHVILNGLDYNKDSEFWEKNNNSFPTHQTATTKIQENAGKLSDAEVQQVQNRADVISYATLAEMTHFQMYRVGDFKSLMQNYLRGQIDFYREVRRWNIYILSLGLSLVVRKVRVKWCGLIHWKWKHALEPAKMLVFIYAVVCFRVWYNGVQQSR